MAEGTVLHHPEYLLRASVKCPCPGQHNLLEGAIKATRCQPHQRLEQRQKLLTTGDAGPVDGRPDALTWQSAMGMNSHTHPTPEVDTL